MVTAPNSLSNNGCENSFPHNPSTQADKIPTGHIATPVGLHETNTLVQLVRLPLDKATPYALNSARGSKLPAFGDMLNVCLPSRVSAPNRLDATGTHVLSVCEPWNTASPILLDAPRTRVKLVSKLDLPTTTQTLNTYGTLFLSSRNCIAGFQSTPGSCRAPHVSFPKELPDHILNHNAIVQLMNINPALREISIRSLDAHGAI
jgi:hypothetical protein